MAKVKQQKPFAVKGIRITSPKGSALWCKVKEPDYAYNAKGIYSTSLICNPDDAATKVFIEKLEELREAAYSETVETLGAVKAKGLKQKDVYVDELDEDGEPTGNIIFKFTMKDVDDKEPGKNRIKVVDAKTKPITPKDLPLVGNGSTIRCVAYANPYYMANTKEVGISLIWESMQLIKLNEYSGGGVTGFDEEDGYEATNTNDSGYDNEDTDEDADY